MKLKETILKDTEWKQITAVRTDLDMGVGKVAAQCQHAQASINYKPHGSVARIVVKVSSQKELLDLMKIAQNEAVGIHPIWDSGRTQVKPGTLTCVAFGPGELKKMDRAFGHLKLL